MYKRLVRLSLIVGAGFVVGLLVWRRRNMGLHQAPQFAPSFSGEPPIVLDDAPLPAEEIEDAIETPPAVREVDLAELAFVAAAVGVISEADDQEQPEQTAALDEADDTDEEGELTGYCMHCRVKRTISDAHEETAKDGRRMARGTCPVCGSNIVRFLKEA